MVPEPRSSVEAPETDDAIRAQLLEAAARVFARQGYDGTKISDIVREAGLSTGSVYGRFRSKNDLLTAAIVERAVRVARLGDVDGDTPRVADIIGRIGRNATTPLTNDEAMRLEAYVAARREPEVARALADATAAQRELIQPLVEAAMRDGSVASDVDPEAVVYLLRTVGLGLLVQRAAGSKGPDPDAWRTLITKVVASFGDPSTGGTPT